MTPLQIDILLHYYVSPTDYRDGDFSAPAVREAMDGFLEDMMIGLQVNKDAPGYAGTYAIRERGRAYVDVLCTVPLPVQRWVMPESWKGPSPC